MCVRPPAVPGKQGTDEIFGLIRNLLKALLIKLPFSRCDQGQGLCIAVTLEWRHATQSEKKDSTIIIMAVSTDIH